MTKGNDYIQFERRYEVQRLMKVIDKYVEQNPKEKDNETLKTLFGMFDNTDMSW